MRSNGRTNERRMMMILSRWDAASLELAVLSVSSTRLASVRPTASALCVCVCLSVTGRCHAAAGCRVASTHARTHAWYTTGATSTNSGVHDTRVDGKRAPASKQQRQRQHAAVADRTDRAGSRRRRRLDTCVLLTNVALTAHTWSAHGLVSWVRGTGRLRHKAARAVAAAVKATANSTSRRSSGALVRRAVPCRVCIHWRLASLSRRYSVSQHALARLLFHSASLSCTHHPTHTHTDHDDDNVNDDDDDDD